MAKKIKNVNNIILAYIIDFAIKLNIRWRPLHFAADRLILEQEEGDNGRK